MIQQVEDNHIVFPEDCNLDQLEQIARIISENREKNYNDESFWEETLKNTEEGECLKGKTASELLILSNCIIRKLSVDNFIKIFQNYAILKRDKDKEETVRVLNEYFFPNRAIKPKTNYTSQSIKSENMITDLELVDRKDKILCKYQRLSTTQTQEVDLRRLSSRGKGITWNLDLTDSKLISNKKMPRMDKNFIACFDWLINNKPQSTPRKPSVTPVKRLEPTADELLKTPLIDLKTKYGKSLKDVNVLYSKLNSTIN